MADGSASSAGSETTMKVYFKVAVRTNIGKADDEVEAEYRKKATTLAYNDRSTNEDEVGRARRCGGGGKGSDVERSGLKVEAKRGGGGGEVERLHVTISIADRQALASSTSLARPVSKVWRGYAADLLPPREF
ncbi:hypothetical protein GUJ93_ZPchr0007g4377 [Zizania palustris]|uniref:Uncharacterized protein n=1 Tax=Zizania palustris TaxID=103762 RepID=A0A8J5W429_ZIZPA|nr:hypothetical protein GUJ93_ZPchr0007g4377 [Zizania palustris]